VNGLDLNWSADGYHKLTVTFAYTSWRDNSLKTLAMDYLENVIADSIFPSQALSIGGQDRSAFQTAGPGGDRPGSGA